MLYGFEVHIGYVVLGDKFINWYIANASYKSTSYLDVKKCEAWIKKADYPKNVLFFLRYGWQKKSTRKSNKKETQKTKKKLPSGQIESRLVENNEIHKKRRGLFQKIEMLWFRH
jgi:retron-type reverse transcriptase